MTAQPEVDVAEALPPADRDGSLDAPHPLSVSVRGVMTVQFEGGAVVSRRTGQRDARAFRRKQEGVEASDHVRWDSAHWFSWDDARVATEDDAPVEGGDQTSGGPPE